MARTIGLSVRMSVLSSGGRRAAAEVVRSGKPVAEAADFGAGNLCIAAVAVGLGSSAGGLALDSLCTVVVVEPL